MRNVVVGACTVLALVLITLVLIALMRSDAMQNTIGIAIVLAVAVCLTVIAWVLGKS